MDSIKVASAGVGNCASSLIQGVTYYKDAKEGDIVPGLMHVTLGGYLFDVMGKVPDEGEEVELEGWALKIHSMEKRRIAEVLVKRVDPESLDEKAGADTVEK